MSGHSKWHKVRQFKGAIDAKRAASFTKLAREITVAAKEKGGDPSFNYRLRTAIDRAKEGLVPRENIERAIARGVGGGDGDVLIPLQYEAYGPGGAALIIECVTDNRNRTASDVKYEITKIGGSFAVPGAVTFLFDRKGHAFIPMESVSDREAFELTCIDAGAEDIDITDEGVEVTCAPEDLDAVLRAIESLGCSPTDSGVDWIAKAPVVRSNEDEVALQALVDALEALDDVQKVTIH